MNNNKLMIIDGNSIINRAFYGIPLLKNEKGLYTNAVYGFLNIFFKLFEEEKPNLVAIAFDVPKKTFRHEMYKEYKGTRKGMPEELKEQMPLLKEVLNKMNITIIEKEGYEADDVLGTLAKMSQQEQSNMTCVVVSGDRDLLQICTDTVKVRIPKTKSGKTEIEDYYKDDVINKYGVTPLEFIDLKGLMGDASDNVPGVTGIGEKTATKIIIEYKTIENAINNIENIKPNKARENLLEQKELALLSKELVTIKTDVPLDFEFEDFKVTDIFNDESFKIVKELNFKSLFNKFTNVEVTTKESKEVVYNLVDNPFIALQELEELNKQKKVFYSLGQDVTTKNLDYVSFLYEKDEKPRVLVFLISDAFNTQTFVSYSKTFFESDIIKITNNSKLDYTFFESYLVNINNISMDLMLGSYILNPSKDSYNYKSLALEYLDEVVQSKEEILGVGRKKISFDELDEEVKCKIIATEIDVYYRSYEIIKNKIIENNQEDLLYDIEMPLAKVLSSMEINGIKVVKKDLISFGDNLELELNNLTQIITELAGQEFNINSPSQLGVILFEKLQLKGSKKTKTGYSTAVDVLEKLKNEHPIINKVLEYRTLSKLKSTYVDGLLNVIDDDDIIRSTFNQTIATTGRISSTEPNLQNIPTRLPLGRELRKVFVPKSSEYIFLDADYSQIELRVLAHISNDDVLIKAFNEDVDIHKLTASQVYHVNIDEVTKDMRFNAKAVNFGIVYGISAFSLGQDLGVTNAEAKRYIEGYFNTYKNVKIYLDNSIEFAKQNGYGQTIFNRRRSINEINSSNFITKSFGERIAMNMPIQGSAADIIKIAMVKVYNKLNELNLDSKIILQVHDELLLEVKKNELEQVKKILIDEMTSCVKLLVPLEVDVHIGNSWFELK